jgi:hypothetical protein
MTRRVPSVQRRVDPPPWTVGRRGRGRRGALRAAVTLAVVGALAAGAGVFWHAAAPQLEDGRRLLHRTLVELGLRTAPPSQRSGGRERAPVTPVERFHAALSRGDVTGARALLPDLPPQDLDRPVGGMTTLMRAASLGDDRLITDLVRWGADPNARGAHQRTALQYAAERNRVAAARALLDAGADIDGVDNGALSPLVMAADRNYSELALMLIRRGANLNLQNVEGWTALMDAAEAGNVRLVEALLDAGARTAPRHRNGFTAMDFARRGGHEEVVRLLTLHQAGGRAPTSRAEPPPLKKGQRR